MHLGIYQLDLFTNISVRNIEISMHKMFLKLGKSKILWQYRVKKTLCQRVPSEQVYKKLKLNVYSVSCFYCALISPSRTQRLTISFLPDKTWVGLTSR